MKFFYDEEFLDDGLGIDIISIGIVSEANDEFYAQCSDINWDAVTGHGWLNKNVVPHLKKCDMGSIIFHKEGRCTGKHAHTCPWRSHDQLRWDVYNFITTASKKSLTPMELWGYYADYDHVALAQLFGTMMDFPEGWPQYTHDLVQWLDAVNAGYRDLIEMPQNVAEHNALSDARWNKWLYDELLRVGRMISAHPFSVVGEALKNERLTMVSPSFTVTGVVDNTEVFSSGSLL